MEHLGFTEGQNQQPERKKQTTDLIKWVALALGAIAYVFSSGRWNFFLTAWIWPAAFLYFGRQAKRWEFALLTVLLTAGQVLKWFGLLYTEPGLIILLCALWGLSRALPFLADRLIARRMPGVALRSLVFPAVFTALELLNALLPMGSLGMMAYTQSGILPLVQVVSVLGCCGLSFLLWWFGSAAVTVLERRQGWKRLAGVYLALLAAVFAFGGIRLAVSAAKRADTVRVACVVAPCQDANGKDRQFSYRLYLSPEARRAADGGAKIACWNEGAFLCSSSEEAVMFAEAKELASTHRMTLIIGYTCYTYHEVRNKSVIVLPDGSVTEYLKTNLVPITEGGVRGTGEIPTVVTENGIISNVICFDDTCFDYVRGAGANTNEHFRDTDILFVPAWDWDVVKNVHSNMSEFRAVENGEALVKPTQEGITTVVDAYGRRILRSDTADTGFDTVQFADVPIRSVHTVYGLLGAVTDLGFGLFGLALLVYGTLTVLKSKRKE